MLAMFVSQLLQRFHAFLILTEEKNGGQTTQAPSPYHTQSMVLPVAAFVWCSNNFVRRPFDTVEASLASNREIRTIDVHFYQEVRNASLYTCMYNLPHDKTVHLFTGLIFPCIILMSSFRLVLLYLHPPPSLPRGRTCAYTKSMHAPVQHLLYSKMPCRVLSVCLEELLYLHKRLTRCLADRAPFLQLLEDALDMRTQQLFHLQKALVLYSDGGEGGEGGTDQPLPQASIKIHARNKPAHF